ncbi:hypothetical protein AB0M29_36075 [Streptomyces sp. NPDC051976]|uniref:hypothetical protein n=1 Tax=Streptomyces sp. NPDC051976 TaxID=3154947 RepID=UPI003425DFF1
MDTHRPNTPPAHDDLDPGPGPVPSGTGAAVEVEQAEAVLVEHYPRLVRLAYLTLPADLGKHRRVLTAHRLVQRSLPRGRRTPHQDTPAVPGPRGGAAYALLRCEVLRGALAYGRGGGGRRVRTALAAAAGSPLPQVVGVRLHPRAGGSEELALDRALAQLEPQARAAFALRGVEELDERAAHAVLAAAGAADPRAALRAAAGVDGARHLLATGEFDPCTLQVRPTDLLRRRQRARIGLVAAAVAVTLAAAGLASAGGGAQPYAASGPPASAAGRSRALDPAALVHPAGQAWAATSRMDFTAWPARGGRTTDAALLGRALAVWADPSTHVDVSATPGTPRTGPVQPPQLLFAGDVDATTVVLFYDGLRIVRYAQPRHGGGRAALEFARVEDADITTAAAVVLERVDGNARYLTAPWVADAQTRDLLRPDRLGSPLHRDADGVTDPVQTPGAGAAAGSCGGTWPVLQLRSSARVVEQHTFLLSDLGELTPVHLTYTPPPGGGAPARQPREATGPQALVSWAHSACRLGALRGQGVRSVNDWEFARTALPEGAGEASWTCERADTWRGPGYAAAAFLSPGAAPSTPGTLVGEQTDGNACSRFGQHVMAGVMWKSPAGHWYLLAAGSRDVARITATGGARATAHGPFLTARAPRGTRATLTGTLTTGGTLTPLGS